MLAFEVLLNGRRLCLAGTAHHSRVLAAALSWTHREPERLDFHVGGVIANADQHFVFDTPEVQVGDEILIRVVNSDTADQPDRIYPGFEFSSDD